MTTPTPPSDLNRASKRLFRAVYAASSDTLSPILDAETVARLCRLLEEREIYAAELLEHGAVHAEVIVSPKGDVVGERMVPNPAEQQLRRIDKAIDAVTAALGLSPTSRARLGVAASDSAILSARWATP